MKSDIIILGGGASGLMAAYSAASTGLSAAGAAASGLSAADTAPVPTVTVLEKMPRPGRKIMITGKGRCNFTNVKDWNEFSLHIRSGSKLVKSAYYSLPSRKLVDFFESAGMPAVIERGDRAFPSSHRSSDVVDALVRACHGAGVKIETGAEVRGLDLRDDGGYRFELTLADGRKWLCRKLVIATGGLSYPSTGSTGDGYVWARETGHHLTATFPSLTALVPRGYKLPQTAAAETAAAETAAAETAGPAETAAPAEINGPQHICRSTPLSETGKLLCGIQLKNVQATLLVQNDVADSEFGDIDFTDGGIEGPIGFRLSRKAVKAMTSGARTALVLDLKPGVDPGELLGRVKSLWEEIVRDPRSTRLRDKEKCRILLGKLMPWELIPAFSACHPGIVVTEKQGHKGQPARTRVDLRLVASALQEWRFELEGYVGYERAVITAGGVSADDIIAKTLESRIVPGMYFCGEVLDTDADTGGYNLQIAFCTGSLAGASAAKSSMDR